MDSIDRAVFTLGSQHTVNERPSNALVLSNERASAHKSLPVRLSACLSAQCMARAWPVCLCVRLSASELGAAGKCIMERAGIHAQHTLLPSLHTGGEPAHRCSLASGAAVVVVDVVAVAAAAVAAAEMAACFWASCVLLHLFHCKSEHFAPTHSLSVWQNFSLRMPG